MLRLLFTTPPRPLAMFCGCEEQTAEHLGCDFRMDRHET